MDRNNETMLTSPNLSYTSRDFSSIYNELKESIPLLTQAWEAKDENDPGVVLLKAMSMVGDMLSYNQDKQALEAFPRTVLQRANAQQIFRLIGYKMHWWRSAVVEASFTNANTFPIMIGRYNTFLTEDRSITYTNLKEFVIPAGASGIDSFKTELVQGIPVTPLMKGSSKPSDYNADWHSIYDYNLTSSNLINDKIYINYENIEENSITLIDNDETPFALNEWTQVKNINLNETMDKVFEFDIDEDGTPYILLPSYWKTKYKITKFKLFFILSSGQNGEIEENTLSTINTSKCYLEQEDISISKALELVSIFNTSSTYGHNPETCVEARKESEKYQNTIDTLVILKDFEKAVRRIDSVANVVATDMQTDPEKSEMSNYQIKLWIVRKNDYNNYGDSYIYASNDAHANNDEIFKENIIGELKSYKLMPYDISINLENKIDWIDWSVSGQIFLRKPINADQNNDLMVRINNNLKHRFNTETLDFNEAVNYMDVIECIMKTDKNIWHVDLDTSAIEYTKAKRSLKGNATGLNISNKYMIYNEANQYSGYYMTSLGCTDEYIEKLKTFDGEYIENVSATNSLIPNIKETVAYGGSGSGKNSGNKIIREDGLETVVGIDFGKPNEPREYEIYNKMIYDCSGYVPINTGRYIDTDTFKIMMKDENGNDAFTGYTIQYDSRMYMTDGSDAHRCLVDGYQQIDSLCDTTIKYSTRDIKSMSIEEKETLVNEGKLRKTYDICDTRYNINNYEESWVGESIDKLSGEIFILRGDYWYSTNRSYDEETGNILDTFGPVLYGDNMIITKELACREDITGEHIEFFDVDIYKQNRESQNKDKQTFELYLGQDADGKPLTNSIGEIIEAYPIKPYSVFIYVNGDEDIIADNGSGKLTGTPGLLDGWGTIDYDTGEIYFKILPTVTSLKIMYKVNKFTYSHFAGIDPTRLFVRPEFIRSDNRK